MCVCIYIYVNIYVILVVICMVESGGQNWSRDLTCWEGTNPRFWIERVRNKFDKTQVNGVHNTTRLLTLSFMTPFFFLIFKQKKENWMESVWKGTYVPVLVVVPLPPLVWELPRMDAIYIPLACSWFLLNVSIFV